MEEHDLEYLHTLMVMHCGHGVWEYKSGPNIFYVRENELIQYLSIVHEVELHHALTEKHGRRYFLSERAAVEAYCKFYKLGPYATQGGNPEDEQRPHPANASHTDSRR